MATVIKTFTTEQILAHFEQGVTLDKALTDAYRIHWEILSVGYDTQGQPQFFIFKTEEKSPNVW